MIKEVHTESESSDCSEMDDDSASDIDQGQRQRMKKTNYRPASKVIDYDDIML